MKWLRGTWLDPFGHSEERRMERALIRQYEEDLAEVLPRAPAAPEAVRALAALPMEIRGFGPVKRAAVERAARRREDLLAAIRMSDEVPQVAE